jgi:two-component system, sensor histidine kinase and response regulator
MSSKKYKELIYIIDEMKVSSKTLAIHLHQYQSICFNDPLIALQKIRECPPDLIISDYEMPNINGVEFLQAVRETEVLKDIPFVICTGSKDEALFEQAFVFGVTEFLSKNELSPLVLRVRIRNILDNVNNHKKVKIFAQEKIKFLRVLCHDLSNPLTIIHLYGKSIRKKLNRSGHKEHEESFIGLELGVKRIKDIINSTRTSLSFEEHKVEMVLATCGTELVVRDILFLTKHLLEKKNIHLVISKPDHQVYFECELNSIVNQVFSNIFTNAIKFTNKNGIIKFDIYEDCRTNEIVFKVTDNGIGIPTEMIAILYDYDKKASRAGTDGEVGTGYGLPLVKSYIENYNGNLIVTSQSIEEFPDDHWTCFTIRLKKLEESVQKIAL